MRSVRVIGFVSSMSLLPGHAGEVNPAVEMSLLVAPLAEDVGRPPNSCSAALAHDLVVMRWVQATLDSQGVRQAWMYLDRIPTAFKPPSVPI